MRFFRAKKKVEKISHIRRKVERSKNARREFNPTHQEILREFINACRDTFHLSPAANIRHVMGEKCDEFSQHEEDPRSEGKPCVVVRRKIESTKNFFET